jgi:hypothetical protein
MPGSRPKELSFALAPRLLESTAASLPDLKKQSNRFIFLTFAFVSSILVIQLVTRLVAHLVARRPNMGCQTKVQLIKRKNSRQWYVNFPAQIAQAMDFKAGEVVEWEIEDRTLLALVRTEVREGTLKKKRRDSSPKSKA